MLGLSIRIRPKGRKSDEDPGADSGASSDYDLDAIGDALTEAWEALQDGDKRRAAEAFCAALELHGGRSE